MSEAQSEPGGVPIADVRTRIIAAARELIATGGRDAATTRAVAAAAGVQAPTIYRLFGDKRGLLDAVAEAGLAAYVASKAARQPNADPVQELRDGWDMHVAFGLAHPGLYAILSGDPHPRDPSSAAAAGHEGLRRRMRAIALAGRLRVSEERAAALFHAMGTGTVLSLLAQPEDQRDPAFSEAARETVLAAILHEPPAPTRTGPRSAATTLHASLDEVAALTSGERHLMAEWLERIADDRHGPA